LVSSLRTATCVCSNINAKLPSFLEAKKSRFYANVRNATVLLSLPQKSDAQPNMPIMYGMGRGVRILLGGVLKEMMHFAGVLKGERL
jgi:hypothetical protein